MRHEEMTARLEALRGQALSELRQVGGFEDMFATSEEVEKNASKEGDLESEYEKIAGRVDEILKTASHAPLHTVGKPRAQVTETGELTRNRVTSMGGSYRPGRASSSAECAVRFHSTGGAGDAGSRTGAPGVTDEGGRARQPERPPGVRRDEQRG
jgi:hypothetical protein